MNKEKERVVRLNEEESTALRAEIRATRKWLMLSGVITLVIFTGFALLGLAGFVLGLVEMTSGPEYYQPAAGDMLIFVIAGLVGFSFCAVCIWLGAVALMTASKGKAFLTSGNGEDLVAYHCRMKKVFVTIGCIAVFGVLMCVIAALLVLMSFLRYSI